MSENKFTPGPWFIVSESRYDGHNIVCQVNRENLICSDALPSIHGRYDANLIAAAPELLEALEGMLSMYPEDMESVGTGILRGFSEEAKKKVANSKRAIAKARGEKE